MCRKTNLKGCDKVYCKKCGKEINDDAVICIHCGCSVDQTSINKTIGTDRANIGLAFLSFFVPVFGWVYGGVKYEEYPSSSKVYIGCGVVGFIMEVFAMML